MQDALADDLNLDVSMLWHKDKDLSRFNTEDCIILPGGFSFGDYLRCGAIARFSPMMQSVVEFAMQEAKYWVFVMASRYYVSLPYYPEHYCETKTSNLFAKMFLSKTRKITCSKYRWLMGKAVIMLMKQH